MPLKTARTQLVLYPFEWIVLGYSSLMILLLTVFGRPFRFYLDELTFYTGVVLLTLTIARTVDDRAGRWQALVRLGYVVVLFTFFYRMTGGLMELFFNRFFDAELASFEAALFGFNPTLYIDHHLLSTWLNELWSLCYFSYYLIIPGFFIPVFVRGDYEIMKQSLAAVSLTYFASYLLFCLYPVEGPRWYFAQRYLHDIEGPIFRPMVEFVINAGAVRGGAMPSSHSGVAIVILMYCLRHYRRVTWVLLPIVMGLAVGTVWGRFHYVSDVVVGSAIAIGATLLIWRIHPIISQSVEDLDRVTAKGTANVS